MKIIFSRKGFDSASGGGASPIFPDGRMVSLPIPDKQSPIRYKDIRWQEYNLGSLVSDLTKGRISVSGRAHLDPDLNADSIPRRSGWRPIFGQTGAAQGHLRNNNVRPGDIFLFFGLFCRVVCVMGKLQWDKTFPPCHVFWGWLQIDDALPVDKCELSQYRWARYHPHFHRTSDTRNTLYVARKDLTVPGVATGRSAGAGVFSHFSKQLQLTATSAARHGLWELPQWFYPRDGKCPLTYHSDMTRWHKSKRGTQLNTVGRGQEFVLNADEYPEASEWLKVLLTIA